MSENLITTENLQVHFPVSSGLLGRTQNYVRAVNNVNIHLSAGEIVSVVGESGCGKSTLGNSILGLVTPTGGRILLQGEEIDYEKRNAWANHRRNFQMIFQDPATSLNPRHTIFEVLTEPLVVHKLCPRSELRDRAAELLKRVGLSPDYLGRYPHSFSGGQRQRICIARVIALNPAAIICDEVTAALDLSIQAQIIELLLQLKNEMGLALLFISHDLSLVRVISQRIYVMYLGSIVEEAPTHELFSQPTHHYTKALLDSIPALDRNKPPFVLSGEVPSPVNIPSGCPFHTRCAAAQQRCREELPPLQKSEAGNGSVRCHFPLNS